jgi:DNA-binding response OmpR family regulator
LAAIVVLVVEDDAAVRRGVKGSLRAAGYDVRECATGEEAATDAAAPEVGLVLLDIGLPGRDGIAVLEELRRNRPTLPVIMLTARGAEDDRVRGLDLGADDYVVKPFSPRELTARVQAVLRRSSERPADIPELKLGKLLIDLARHELRLENGSTRALSTREVELLRFLAAHRGRAVGRSELLRQLWQCDPRGIETRTVDMQVARLREKIEPEPSSPRFLLTVRGKGYMLAREDEP